MIMRLRGSQAGPRLRLLVLASVEASVKGGPGLGGVGAGLGGVGGGGASVIHCLPAAEEKPFFRSGLIPFARTAAASLAAAVCQLGPCTPLEGLPGNCDPAQPMGLGCNRRFSP